MLTHQVLSYCVDDFSLEHDKGVFNRGVGFGRHVAAGFVEFRIEAAVVAAAVFGPEIFEADIFRQPFEGLFEAGFRHRFFNAKLEAVPEKFASACGWLGGGAKVVVGRLAEFAQVVEFGEGHLAENV